MRKLFGLLSMILLSLALLSMTSVSMTSGGAFIGWPGRITAQWNTLKTLAERQLATELATFDQILTGKLKIGETPAQSGKKDQPSMSVAAPVSKPPRQQVKVQIKTGPKKAETSSIIEQSHIAPAQPQAARIMPMAPPPADSTPEAALGAILKHETRENQAKEETFWTEERIQEALKNGAPKSNSAPCIALCDKNDTAIEINMPKSPPITP